MSYISAIKALYKNLLDALHWAKIACRAADRVNAEVQGSNASDALKATVAAWHAATLAACQAIQDFKDGLPGN